ncbi:MAG: Coenzyme F420 hydrogenase/dehydrogenase, beta subunit C-terminal domain [Promethearchaeota archaeon]
MNGRKPLKLDEIIELFDFDEKKIIRDIFYLKEQGYIEEISEFASNQKRPSEDKVSKMSELFKYKVIETKDSYKVNYFEPVSLINDSGICCHCGLCSTICPLDCIDQSKNYLYLDEEMCIKCGLCYSVCPNSFPFEKIYNHLKKSKSAINYSENFGLFKNIYSARTLIEKLREKGQDGGVVTSLLYYLLDKNIVDAVITTRHSENLWIPKFEIIEDKNDLYKTAGRIYAHYPILSKLYETKKYERIAIVALPCSIKALAKSSLFPIKFPFFKNIKYKIGLFCIEAFPYENISYLIQNKFNVEIDEIIKMKIYKGRFFITLDTGEESSIPFNECDPYGYKYCHYCDDLTAELADISIGSIGSKIGWSSVITRNKKGEEIFNGAIKEGLIENKALIDVKTCHSVIEKIAEQKRNKCITIELHKIQ